MPYILISGDFDEMGLELDERDPDNLHEAPASGGFSYEPATGRFEVKGLNEVARRALEALRGVGAGRLRVTYDGGYDEGFAQAASVTINGVATSAADVAKLLASSEFATWLRDRPKGVNPRDDFEWIRTVPDAIDELAFQIASVLLGEGYGTGEYELYGALDADLTTGQITDDKHATKPPAKE
jgi:hypothetical protein